MSSMVNITFFEVHLDDAQFESKAPLAGEVTHSGPTDEDVDSETGAALAGESGGGPKLAPLVLGVVLLVALAALARKLRGRKGGSDEADGESVEPTIEAA